MEEDSRTLVSLPLFPRIPFSSYHTDLKNHTKIIKHGDFCPSDLFDQIVNQQVVSNHKTSTG